MVVANHSITRGIGGSDKREGTNRLQLGCPLVSILLVGGTTRGSTVALGGDIGVVRGFVRHREDGIWDQ